MTESRVAEVIASPSKGVTNPIVELPHIAELELADHFHRVVTLRTACPAPHGIERSHLKPLER